MFNQQTFREKFVFEVQNCQIVGIFFCNSSYKLEDKAFLASPIQFSVTWAE